MKKLFTLILAAAGFAATADAQVMLSNLKSLDNEKIAGTPIVMAPATQAAEATEVPADALKGMKAGKFPRRTVANKVWYQKPSGVFYQTANGNGYCQLLIPAFTDLTFTSKYTTDASAVTWGWGSGGSYTALSEDLKDANGNHTNSWNKSTGTGAFYGPTMLVEGVDTFYLGKSEGAGYVLVVPADSLQNAQLVPANGGHYTGWADWQYGTCTGTAQRILNGDTIPDAVYYVDNLYEYHPAPAKPLYVSSLWFYGSYDSEPVADNSKGVTAYFIQKDDAGRYTDTVGVIPITKETIEYTQNGAGYWEVVTAYPMVYDAEFDQYERKPFILSKDYMVMLSGFHNEGVDFSLSMAYMPENEKYTNGGIYPTVWEEYWVSDNAYRRAAWRTSQYNMVVRLSAFFDVVNVFEGFDDMTAPVDGGAISTTEEFTSSSGGTVHYASVQFQSTLPWVSTWEENEGDDNYRVEGLPDWLSVTDRYDWYTSNYGYAYGLVLTAEALPDGMDGRNAEIRIVSDKGADSGIIKVYQGDRNATAIKGVTLNENTNSVKRGTYNLAGQRVGNDYKGIVIENGKKVIKK